MNTAKSYKLAIIELIMFAITISLSSVAYIFDFTKASSIIAMPMMIASILSFIGSYYSLKGLPEPNNKRKIIAMITNFGFSALFLFLIISNILDIVKVFNK